MQSRFYQNHFLRIVCLFSIYILHPHFISNFLIIASYFTILGLVFNHIVNDLLS